MENTKYGKRWEWRWTPLRAKAQDTRANHKSWKTHLVRKRWDIGLLQALSLRIMMMMMNYKLATQAALSKLRRKSSILSVRITSRYMLTTLLLCQSFVMSLALVIFLKPYKFLVLLDV